MKPLPDTWFGNTFSQSVACLFIFSTGSFFHRAKIFHFDEVECIDFFSFLDHAFDVRSEKSSPSSGLIFFLCYLLNILWFWIFM